MKKFNRNKIFLTYKKIAKVYKNNKIINIFIVIKLNIEIYNKMIV